MKKICKSFREFMTYDRVYYDGKLSSFLIIIIIILLSIILTLICIFC